MCKSTASPEFECRISPRLAAIVLASLGTILLWVSQDLPDPQMRPRFDTFAYLTFAISGVAWWLDTWKPCVSRWFTVIALIAIVYFGARWLDAVELLVLLVIPTVLSASLISVFAAGGTVVAETVLLLLTQERLAADPDQRVLWVTLAAVWGTFGVMSAVYQSVYQVTQWSWQYYQRAQDFMKEAGDRQVELKQALEDLGDANLQLTRLNMLAQGLRQKAEEAQRAKEQFVAMVSHELRTPLNMIIGFTEMIVQVPEIYGRNLSPSLLADLDVVLRNSQHLSKLIDDVLDLSQMEADQIALSKERVPFRQIIEMAAIAVRPLFESKKLYLHIDIADGLPAVFCDPTRIRQVVLNLLSNAGRFTHTGGVHLRAWQEGPYIVASVADTGSGISPEEMGKLFQPFQQLDASIRRLYGGTGLGLSISKRFIELHEGTIWAESEQGTGTTFFFRLPIDPPAPLTNTVSRWFSPYFHYEESIRSSSAPVPVLRPRFVVLEKGNTLNRLLTRYLDGAEIVCVDDPREAVRELRSVPSQALLVNDVTVDGPLWPIDESLALPEGTPVITCYIPGIDDSTRVLGIADYIVKPISRDTLLGTLDRLHLEGKTLLLVDDESEALRLFRRMLLSSGRGYRMLQATDGREATRILREERPDAILLDLVMPDMDGFQFLAQKSRDPALRDIPVVVISARDPMGQPIVSNRLAVTQRGGLSTPQLLACIEEIARILSTVRLLDDPMPTRMPAG